MNKFVIAILFAFAAAASADTVQCYECNAVVSAIEQWGLTNSSIEEVQKKLDYVCDSVPGFASVCESVVAYGLPYVIQIIQTETPEKVCEQLNLCTAAPTSAAVMAVRPMVDNSVTCVGCTYVISAVEGYLLTSTDEAVIQKKLDQLCAYVPNFETICDALAAQELQQVVSWIQAENTTVVCQKLSLCSASALVAKPMITFNQIACEACQVLVGAADQYLLNGNTIAQVQQKVESIFCGHLPSAFASTCDAIADQGFEAVLKVANSETPVFACTQQLKVCPTSAVKPLIIKA